ncbi:phosphatase PAP2 family protein [Aliikangiella maris]|uniref:Phosphatase PAP2 family protein n=2 Tax=Aliikangiella maris TaxID=3162458 RepID=A0ABV2BT18_9GAMM
MGMLKAQFQQLDNNAFLWVQQKVCHSQHLPLSKFISFTGDGWFYLMIAAGALLHDAENNQDFIYSSIVAYAIELQLYFLLKHKFKRNRPQAFFSTFKARIKPSDQFSFPSGHTAAAFVMATQLIIYFPVFGILAICWALSIGLSRVLLGVHFPGDILAGMSLGILSALLAGEIYYLI